MSADLTILGPRDCGSFASRVVLADISGDGCDDLIIADGGAVLPYSAGAFMIVFGRPDLRAGTVLNWREGDQPDLSIFINRASYLLNSPFTVGDFDGDGALDLAVNGEDYWNGGRGVIHLLRGPITPDDGPAWDLATRPAAYTINAPVGTEIIFADIMAMGDLNGDGKDDLAIGNPMMGWAESFGFVSILYGRDFPPTPAEWDLSTDPADVIVQTGTYGDFRYFGEPLAVADYNDDGRLDLLVADPWFGSQIRGALFFIDGTRFGQTSIINLTETPADLTVVGRTELYPSDDNFYAFALAGPTADAGSSLWFTDLDAVRDDEPVGEMWHLGADQLAGTDSLLLDDVTPAELFYGTVGTSYGADLAIGALDDNDARDVVVSANYFALAEDGGKIRGAAFVFFDRLTAPPPPPDDDDDTAGDDDDDTIADDDDNDTTPADDDDNDDNDDEGCAC